MLQVEQDKHALAVLERHWPDVERITDVRDVGGNEQRRGDIATVADSGIAHGADRLGDYRHAEPCVDLIYGGFPCQDVSVAGKRAGLDGERSGLWFEFHRIVRELRPRWVCIENVPGLLSSNGGADFAVILSGLDDLGFDAAWTVLDSQHFGVAQRRRRVFIVGGPRGRGAEQVLSLCESCGGNPETGGAAGEGTTGALSAGTLRAGGVNAGNNPGGGYLPDIAYALAASVRGTGDGHGNAWNSTYVANPLAAPHGRNDLDHDTYVADTLRSHPRPGSNSTGAVVPTLGAIHGVDGLAHAITASAGHHGHSSPRGDGADNLDAFGGNDTRGPIDVSTALTAHPTGRYDFESDTHLVGAQGVRRLTPTECERLQGFPDGWTRYGSPREAQGDKQRDLEWHEQADSHRYKQMGNAVTVPVAEWIGHRLIAVDRLAA